MGVDRTGEQWLQQERETISDRHPGGAEQHDPGQGTGQNSP